MPANTKEETFTLSKLQMYDECPQKYKLCYLDKVRILEKPDTSAAQKGNNLHNLINYYLKGQDVIKLLTALNPIEQELWENFKNSEIHNYKFLKSEYAFNVNIEGHWFNGRIDALFKYRDEYLILDWKTSENFNGENVNFQTEFYLMCLYEILKSTGCIDIPEQLSMYYVNLATNNIIKIKLVKSLLLQYRTRLLGIVEKTNKDKTFFCNKSDKCKICKYSRACSFY